MGTEIADRNNPAQQMSVNEDGSINSNLQDGDGNIVSSAAPLPVSMDSDIQIGAVEIKDGETDTRAKVKSDGTDNGLVTIKNSSIDMEGGGKISVGISAVEVTFTGTTKSIIITADSDNSGILYVGKSNVTNTGSNALLPLLPGESVTIDYEDSTNGVYVVGSAVSQNFWKGSLI